MQVKAGRERLVAFDRAVRDIKVSGFKEGYEASIKMLRRHNRKLYGDAPQRLADWLDADNVRPPEAK